MSKPKTAEIIESMKRIGFKINEDEIRRIFTECSNSGKSPMQVMATFVDEETRERKRVNLTRRTKTASLGSLAIIAGFDWDHPKSINRKKIEELLNLEFMQKGENILIRGACGLGKTMIAKNIANGALLSGMSVRFNTVANLLSELMRQDGIMSLDKKIKMYSKFDLLVLDELGYVPHLSRGADLLYQIISQRHELKSTIVTTNLAYRDWGTVFDNAASIHAIVDRFAQHCHVIDIEGESYRLKKLATT